MWIRAEILRDWDRSTTLCKISNVSFFHWLECTSKLSPYSCFLVLCKQCSLSIFHCYAVSYERWSVLCPLKLVVCVATDRVPHLLISEWKIWTDKIHFPDFPIDCRGANSRSETVGVFWFVLRPRKLGAYAAVDPVLHLLIREWKIWTDITHFPDFRNDFKDAHLRSKTCSNCFTLLGEFLIVSLCSITSFWKRICKKMLHGILYSQRTDTMRRYE